MVPVAVDPVSEGSDVRVSGDVRHKKSMRVTVFGSVRELGDVPRVARADLSAVVQWLAKGAKAEYRSSKSGRRVGTRRPVQASCDGYGPAGSVSESGSCKRLLSNIADEFAAKRSAKRLKVSDERGLAVERAMADTPDCPFNSLPELEAAIHKWAYELFSKFDANQYYTKERAEGYQANLEIQERLTARSLDLLGVPQLHSDTTKNGAPSRGPCLVLDIACGSGLSTAPILKRLGPAGAGFVIGCDLASAMLERAVVSNSADPLLGGYIDFVLHDMKQPLPFRDGAFDQAVSISAAHYLSRSARDMQVFYSGIRRVTTDSSANFNQPQDGPIPRAVLQFFPAEQNDEPRAVACAAKQAGWGRVFMVLDHTHRTKSYRWYLCLCSDEWQGTVHKCAMYQDKTASCLLCLPTAKRCAPPEYVDYSVSEHCRFLHKLARTKRHDPSLLSTGETRLVNDLFEALGGDFPPSLVDIKSAYMSKLHGVLHASNIEPSTE